MASRRTLIVERLEDRCVPATWGNPWPDAPHLTLSFAPDGTQVGDRTSVLFQSLNPYSSSSAWQLAILRAFQTWAVNANVNVSAVPDGGQPFGTQGAIQGDPRFGDVRLAAFAMDANGATGNDVLAIASPFEVAGGTWSGDVKLNTAYTFGTGGAGQYDLYTILLHEAGHVFGLEHSADPASIMYEDYLGARTGLSAGDVAALQSLYGARTPDAFEGSTGNNQRSAAASLNLLSNSGGILSLQADADVTTNQDVDWYKFTTLLNTGAVTLQLKTSGISSLAPRVTVYNSAGAVVASAISTNPFNGDLSLRLNGVSLLSTYYVKVEGSRSDAFGIGGYQLKVNELAIINPLTGAVANVVQNTTTTLLNVDLHTNDTFLTALNLGQLLQKGDSRFAYVFKGSISDSRDVDFYRFTTPSATGPAANVLTAMIWGLDPNGLYPKVIVYDANQNVVAASVLVNEAGSYTIQIPNAVAGATYYVEALASNPQGTHNVGNYFLGIDFSTKAVSLQTFASSTLDASTPQAFGTLAVVETQLLHLVLSADTHDGRTGRRHRYHERISAQGHLHRPVRGRGQERGDAAAVDVHPQRPGADGPGRPPAGRPHGSAARQLDLQLLLGPDQHLLAQPVAGLHFRVQFVLQRQHVDLVEFGIDLLVVEFRLLLHERLVVVLVLRLRVTGPLQQPVVVIGPRCSDSPLTDIWLTVKSFFCWQPPPGVLHFTRVG
jgi:hypothetical protein